MAVRLHRAVAPSFSSLNIWQMWNVLYTSASWIVCYRNQLTKHLSFLCLIVNYNILTIKQATYCSTILIDQLNQVNFKVDIKAISGLSKTLPL